MNTIIKALRIGLVVIGSIPKTLKVNKLNGGNADKYTLQVTSNLSRKITKIMNVEVKVEGVENIPEGPCCFIGNHQGNFDFLALVGIINKPVGFIAKEEIKKVPIIKSWLFHMKSVFINRKDIRQSLKAINEGAEYLKNGHSMIIFPEGTRSKGPTMGEFKKGSMKMAVKSKATIVPFSIEGSYKFLEDNNKLKGGIMKICFASPIETKNLEREELRRLPEKVEDIVRENLIKIQREE